MRQRFTTGWTPGVEAAVTQAPVLPAEIQASIRWSSSAFFEASSASRTIELSNDQAVVQSNVSSTEGLGIGDIGALRPQCGRNTWRSNIQTIKFEIKAIKTVNLLKLISNGKSNNVDKKLEIDYNIENLKFPLNLTKKNIDILLKNHSLN